MTDPNPFDNICLFVDRRIGLIRERGSNDFLYAGFACSGGQNSRIDAVTGDDSENFRRLHRPSVAEKVRLRETRRPGRRGDRFPKHYPW